MKKKNIIVGDSHTFYMSGDLRGKYFLEAVQKDDIELYPIYWTSSFNDPDDTTVYSWRMATSARKLTDELIEEIVFQNKDMHVEVANGARLVFALGAQDFAVHIGHTKNSVEAAEYYFDAVYKYCTPRNIEFLFVSPVYCNQVSYLIDEFNNTLSTLCGIYKSGNVITYPAEIPYKEYNPVDKFGHASREVMQSVAAYIKESLKNI